MNNSIPTDDDKKSTTPATITINTNSFEVLDGPLDPNSNYTGFVEVIGKSMSNFKCYSQ